ncbi:MULTISPECIES: hypothetical protein [Arthrobacter]|uniref:Uncharacterized protein n=1 Tax=Arthrobacter terricola TaxID=2547396 RepID=A0A4R5K790_9MICC|nr:MULTISPECIES: hypothetical protein [Arthrobacter]MBT8163615.1 hypothetical protein [Arthrobacter sp. GN70]TDF88553.1 hypothetical protein E1809_23860 [Arthrobacter terricola]
MTIIQRTFSAAFRHGQSAHRWSTRSGREAENSVAAEVRPHGASARITAAPWAGLYLEVDDAGGDGATRQPEVSDLERFLASIMYGE